MTPDKDRLRRISALKRKQSIDVFREREVYGKLLYEKNLANAKLSQLKLTMQTYMEAHRNKRQQSETIDPVLDDLYRHYFSELEITIYQAEKEFQRISGLVQESVALLHKKNASLNMYETKETELSNGLQAAKVKSELVDLAKEKTYMEVE
ncbi:hypothetical protein TDB9533_02881 [Thalassocella blandensis]|nr:hypothetical protein TDB9533_02881 [Thalassocella blandensis]